MSAITDKGFERPTYAQLLEAQEARAKQYLGDDVDTGEYSALGKFIRITVYDLAALYEAMEGVYFARFPNYAAGINLDRLMPFAGISRNPPVAAVFDVKFLGDAGAEIPPGFNVATADGVMFRTEQTWIIGENGSVTAPVTCTVRGVVGNVAPGSITIIVNPVAQVRSIEQLDQAVTGQARESDAALRARFSVAIAGIGSATLDAVKAAVLRVPGVTGCVITENDSAEATPGGIPPHSFETYVLSATATDQEIADAIFSKKPMGIQAYGTVTATVLDAGGGEHIVGFSRVAQIALMLKMTLKVSNVFPADGAAQVRSALAGYINVYPAGKDLVFSSLYQVIYSVTGVVAVQGLGVSADGGGTYTQDDVVVPAAGAVRVQQSDIAVEVEPYVDQ